jgi:HEAT repeat protein
LGSFSDPRAVQPLIDALQDGVVAVRVNAATSLGSYYRDTRVISALLHSADDESARVRSGTARAMAHVQDDRIAAKLQLMTEDSDSDVRLLAASALQYQAGDRMVFERVGLNVEDKVESAIAAILSDDVMDEGDMELLRNSNPRVRARLLEVVGEQQSEQGVKLVIPGLKDINPAVRKTAVDTLARMGASAIPALIDALGDSSQYVRAGAVEALAIIGGEQVIKPVCQQMNDDSEIVRREVVRALGKFQAGDDVVRALRRGLKDSDKDVRDVAEQSLLHLGVNPSNPLARFFRRLTGDS